MCQTPSLVAIIASGILPSHQMIRLILYWHGLRDDLQYLEREHGLRPDLVVLSGDLAEWGLKPEFDDLLPFVEGLIQLLKLPRIAS